jgi:magnesium-transporting ATPase (P-type)
LRDVHSSNFCLTLDGSTFEALRIHDPALLEKVAVRAKVFARMAPEDKQRLIEILQRMG